MPEHVNPVDPLDLGLLPTFRRLMRLWWAERRLGFVGLSFALAYTLISTTIPLLMQRAIDRAIVHHTQRLWPYLLAIVALGALRFLVNFMRRYATARIGIRIEARMRELLYRAYLGYPRAFYDRHATGQVLSRATNDLYPIRYFIGWGLVQGMQSVMMIVGAGIVLVVVDAAARAVHGGGDAADRGARAPLRARACHRSPGSVQERKGDVTEAADEAVVGIEMVQAFGREDDVRGALRRQGRGGARHRAPPGGRRGALPSRPVLPAVPLDRRGACSSAGGEVIGGHLTIGQFVLFRRSSCSSCGRSRRSAGSSTSRSAPLASAGRSFAWLEGIAPLPEPLEPTRPARQAPFPYGSKRSASPTAASTTCCASLDLAIEPGEIVAVCGSTGAGKTSLLNLLPRFYDPTGGRVLVGGVDTRDVPIAELRASVALVTQRARPLLRSAAREPHRRPRRRGLGRRCSPRAPPPASTPSSTSFRTVTTR